MSGERVILTLFAQLALILAATRLMGWVFARLRQPQIVGEMLAGMMLGPTLLGWIAPEFYFRLFPNQTMPFLAALAQLAAVFFVFLIGLDLDLSSPRARSRSTMTIALASILLPFVVSFVMTMVFFDWKIAAFSATALTATSFPLLGRILTDRNLHSLQIGQISITAAMMSNLITWALLAIIILLVHFSVRNITYAAIYLAAMVLLMRPLLQRLLLIFEQRGKIGHNMLAAILLLLIASAFAAQWTGLHALLGALLLGGLMPKDPKFVRQLSEKFRDFVQVCLLPLVFAYVGVNSRFDALQIVTFTLVLFLTATIARIGSTMLATHFSGASWRDSAAVGVLLNTRGLMLLLILIVGLQLNVIPPTLFTALVLVALVTTAMTSPLLQLIQPAKSPSPAADAQHADFSILIPISLPKSGGPLVQIADALIGPARESGKLLALHLRRPNEHDSITGHEEQIESEAALIPLLSQAQARSLPVEPLAFTSNDIPADIAQTAANQDVNLVLMGYHNPIFGKAMLGGTVHRVLSTCPTHVAVFVDRGLRNIDRILVPYLGSVHDMLAVELAARIAQNSGAQAVILHVVPPMTASAGKSAEAKRVVERIFESHASAASASFQVVEDSSPVGVILHRARDFDLVIIGVAEEWGLESRLFGWRSEKVARDCPASLLIVRSSARTQDLPASSDLTQPRAHPAPHAAM